MNMLAPQLFYAPSLFVDYGNLGTRVNPGQEGGMQGNPLGTIQPRPYPTTDAVGNPNSFGMSLVPPFYGSPNWVAIRPFRNQNSEQGLSGMVDGLMRTPNQVTSF